MREHPSDHEPLVVTPDPPTPLEKAAHETALAHLIAGAAALLFALAVTLYVLWLIVAQPRAVPFDADGVRCYQSARQMSCIKTAEPSR